MAIISWPYVYNLARKASLQIISQKNANALAPPDFSLIFHQINVWTNVQMGPLLIFHQAVVQPVVLTVMLLI